MNSIWIRNLTLTLSLTLAASLMAAQNAPAAAAAPTAPAASTTTTAPAVDADHGPSDSRSTRGELDDILRRLPQEVGMMLKMDPTLFRNDQWMAAYPELKAFLAQHPEIAQNVNFYFDSVSLPRDTVPETPAFMMAHQMMEAIQVLTVMLLIIGTLTWLIKTLLDHRRWSRTARVQAEVQNKLLDRFTSHEELLRYVQSGAGRDFIQAAMAPAASARTVGAPVNRMLWSLQIGVVLFTLGIGFQVIGSRLPADFSTTFSSLGILTLCAGIGFVLSAVVAWVVSRKVGLLPEQPVETETLTPRTLGE